jgi:hypothetical protein
MGVKFYEEHSMSEARAALEARLLLWPGVEPTIQLDCPTYLFAGRPFAVLVDGAVLVPALPDHTMGAAPPEVNVQPMRQNGLALEGWVRLLARSPENVLLALALIRASYDTVRAAALNDTNDPQ